MGDRATDYENIGLDIVQNSSKSGTITNKSKGVYINDVLDFDEPAKYDSLTQNREPDYELPYDTLEKRNSQRRAALSWTVFIKNNKIPVFLLGVIVVLLIVISILTGFLISCNSSDKTPPIRSTSPTETTITEEITTVDILEPVSYQQTTSSNSLISKFSATAPPTTSESPILTTTEEDITTTGKFSATTLKSPILTTTAEDLTTTVAVSKNFSCPPVDTYDIVVQEYPVIPAVNESQERINLLTWFALETPFSDYSVCYVKVRVTKPAWNHFVQVATVVTNVTDPRLNITQDYFYGKHHSCIVPSEEDNIGSACIETRSSGYVYTHGYPQEQYLEEPRFRTYIRKDQDLSECKIIDKNDAAGGKILNDGVTFEMPIEYGETYGSDYGIYCIFTAESSSMARSFAESSCRRDEFSDIDENLPNMKHDSWVVHYDCS